MARDRARGGQAGGGAGPRSSAGGRAALAGPSRGSRSAPGVYTLSFRHGIKFQAAPEAPGAGRRPGRGEELERDLRPRGADVQAPRGWAQLGPRARGGGGSPAGGVRRVRGCCEARPGGRSIPRVSRTRCFRSLGPENLPLGEEGLLRAPLVSSAALPPVPLIYYPVPAIVGGDLWVRGGAREETSSFPARPGPGLRRPRAQRRRLPAAASSGLGARWCPGRWASAGSSRRHRLCKQLRAALPARAGSLTQTPCRRLSGWGRGGGARLL